MANSIVESPIRPVFYLNPALWAVVNLLVSLYGILFKGWNLQPIVYLFWIEVILNILSALIRVAGAMNGQSFWQNIGQKLVFLLGGSALGIAFIMLTVTFTFKVFDGGFKSEGFGDIHYQVYILAFNYLAALLLHYFLNGRFRTAEPAGELMSTFVYMLVLLVIIMVITQHILPKFPGADQAMWTGLVVVGVKFAVDWIFSSVRKSLREVVKESQ